MDKAFSYGNNKSRVTTQTETRSGATSQAWRADALNPGTFINSYRVDNKYL